MFARVSRLQVAPDQVEEIVQYFDSTTEAVNQMEGFKDAYVLVDRESGKVQTVTFWETREAIDASRRAADELRQQAVGQRGGDAPAWEVEVYEVAASR